DGTHSVAGQVVFLHLDMFVAPTAAGFLGRPLEASQRLTKSDAAAAGVHGVLGARSPRGLALVSLVGEVSSEIFRQGDGKDPKLWQAMARLERGVVFG